MHVEEYRRKYRESVIPPTYDGNRNVRNNVACCAGMIGGSVLMLEQWSWGTALAFAGGALAFNGLEYSFHRWVSHEKRPALAASYRRHAGEHHGFFDAENMSSPSLADYHVTIMPTATIAIYFIAFLLILGLPIGLIAGRSAGAAFSLAIAVSLFQLDILHHYYHVGSDTRLARLLGRFAYFRYLKALHARHHAKGSMAHQGFNITHPLFDWILGTLGARHGS